ncbi:MAG: M56 family metallopeptidase, partial [Planctomycetaceae bacterium]|nr:M56 family metallopeptidase [Planctomycetaceae bacterium]
MNGFVASLNGLEQFGVWGLRYALLAGLSASLLAAAVLLVNLLLRRWLSAGQLALLWALVLVRLLLPVAPASPLSLQNMLRSGASARSNPLQMAVGLQPVAEVDSPARSAERDWLASPPPIVAPTARFAASDALWAALPIAWLALAAGLLLHTLVAQVRFLRRLPRQPRRADPVLDELWRECRELAGVRREIPIVVGDDFTQPALCGYVRPKLLLPTFATELTGAQLRMIMLHELAHVRRGDVASNWLLAVVRAFHWWNPVFWLASARFQSLREQACDAFAIRRLAATPVREYRELLLALAERQPHTLPWRVALPASLLGFWSAS